MPSAIIFPLQNLKTLDVQECPQVTEQGIEALQEQIPDLAVLRDENDDWTELSKPSLTSSKPSKA